MKIIRISGIVSAVLAIASVGAAKETVVATSGTGRVQLIELYSSESCSSCPPADKWMSSLRDDRDLWSGFVPVVFHVDYWNQLNWVDRLSSKAMTERQVSVSRTWSQPRVYTPAVVADGKEWTSWSAEGRPKTQKDNAIRLTILKVGQEDYTVRAAGALDAKSYVVHFVLLGSGLRTKVGAGENAGRELKHDFVVLSWDQRTLRGPGDAHFRFSKPGEGKTFSVAAWIEEKENPVPLQAAGGDL